MPAKRSRILASSSSIRISAAMSSPVCSCWRVVPLGFVLAFRTEDETNPGAALAGDFVGSIAQLDAAAVFFDNAPDDGETEAGALLARRHIGLEQPVAVLFRKSD